MYKCLDLKDEILVYNFRTIDVEKLELGNISEDNPLKLAFYDKVKNQEQAKALADFLEYLF